MDIQYKFGDASDLQSGGGVDGATERYMGENKNIIKR
jgi:hypothetical protein